jgi:hypothetical protein
VAIFELIVPLLNLCDALSIFAKNPLNHLNGFHLAIAKLLANLMQYRCLSHSIIFAQNNKCDTRCVYTFTHMLAARNWCCLLVGKNPHKRMKVPTTFIPQRTSCTSLVSAEKNHVEYFLNRPHIFSRLAYLNFCWFALLFIHLDSWRWQVISVLKKKVPLKG